MVQRFSSRQEAQDHAYDLMQEEQAVYWPRGYRYQTFPEVFRTMNRPAATWTYHTPDATQGTMVVMHNPTKTTKEYTVLAQHKGEWYCDFPAPPYLLYQRYAWINAETVYVCEGERTADAVEALGLAATTSLGGPTREKQADWTPLKGKQVVVLSDFDDKGRDYAQAVAQLCLGVGALSARVVMFPGVKIGEGPCEWMDNIRASLGDEAILPELQKLVDASALVEYVPPVPEPPKGVQLEFQTFAEIEPATQQWVFDKVIPQGKLTVLMGESGVGKSLTALEIAAKVTRGLTWPHDDQPQKPGSVILFAPEDSPSENIRPRLVASQADLSKVILIPGFSEQDEETEQKLSWTFQLDRDMSFLETKLKSLQQADANIRMLVIDPIDCFLESAKVKKKAMAEHLAVRLAKLAAETGLAIVIVTNLPRGVKGFSPLNSTNRRAGDMGPFGAAARSVWMVGQDLDNRNRRLLLPIKTNYCELPNSMAYQIVDGVIQWEQDGSTLTGDEYLTKCGEYLQDQKRAAREAQSKLAKAMKWLRGMLLEKGGPLAKEQLVVDADANNITKATLRRAYDALDCRSVNNEFQGKWYWYLKEMIPKRDEEFETTEDDNGVEYEQP